MKWKWISIVIIFALTFSMIPNNTYATDDNNDFDGGGGVLDYNTFTPASKIAYEATFNLEPGIHFYPPNMRTFADLVDFFNANNIATTAGQTTKDQLRKGDIVQLKNSDSAFLVYVGTNASTGAVILDDIYNRFECSSESFNLLFTGNTILINHTTTKRTIIDTSTIHDDPIHDVTLRTAPMRIGLSASNSIIYEWNHWQNTRLRVIAVDEIKPAGGSTRDGRMHAIWNWMHGDVNEVGRHMWYHFHYATRESVDETLNKHAGNCVEQARMCVAFARAMGIPAAYYVSNTHGHTWASIQRENGEWVAFDTSKDNTQYGKEFYKPEQCFNGDYPA